MKNLHLYVSVSLKHDKLTLKNEFLFSNHVAKRGRRFKFMFIFCHEYFVLLFKLSLVFVVQKVLLQSVCKRIVKL